MAEHAFDPQADAFRNSTDEDWVDDDVLAAMVSSGKLIDTTEDPIVPVEEYESQNWDEGRHPLGPKTLREAKEVLRARVIDPRSPDWDSTVYDDLDGE